MFAWLAHFIERQPFVHRIALSIWRRFPPRLAGFLRGMLTTNWAVAAVAVILDLGGTTHDVLLVEHSYRTKGIWGLPGGSLESKLGDPRSPAQAESDDNVLESTLRREIFEELGVEIEILDLLRLDAVPYVPEEPGPYRLDFYYRCAPTRGFDALRDGIASGKIRPRSPEIKSLRMVPLSSLHEYDLFSCDHRLLYNHLPKILPDICSELHPHAAAFAAAAENPTSLVKGQ